MLNTLWCRVALVQFTGASRHRMRVEGNGRGVSVCQNDLSFESLPKLLVSGVVRDATR